MTLSEERKKEIAEEERYRAEVRGQSAREAFKAMKKPLRLALILFGAAVLLWIAGNWEIWRMQSEAGWAEANHFGLRRAIGR